MKKQYISPETLSLTLRLDRIMQTGSVTVQSDTLEHSINVGEDAASGTSSDSRRQRDIWADEEDEDLY